MGFITTRVKKNRKKEKAIEEGVQALLRNELVRRYREYETKGELSILDKENIEAMFIQYENLGGNGTVKHLMEELLSLPTKVIKGQEEKSREYLLIGIIAIIVFIVLILILKVESFRNRANALFLEAEKNVTEDKFQYVYDNLYDYVPTIIRIFITDETFKEIVQFLYDNTRKIAKDLLDDGKLNKSNKGE